MKLSEIAQFSIQEAEGDKNAGPVEVKDVVDDRSPEIAKKYLRALWGKPRLVFNGKPFFGLGSGDTVYDDIDSVLDEVKNQGFVVDMSLDVPDTDELDGFELTWKATVDEMQEVYLGYSPREDALYVGVDAWLSENDFNEAWDREFANETGEEFDHENEAHAAMFDAAWKEYRDMGFVGILFKLEGEPIENAEEEISVPGGFYKGIYRGNTLKHLGLIDLRLD